MKLIIAILSLFPFTFAAALALWSFVLLVQAANDVADAGGRNGRFDPPGLGLALGAVLAAGAACMFGMIGYSTLQQVWP